MSNRYRAVDLLAHYLSTVFRAAGLDWDSDNNAEIENLMDLLIGVMREEIGDHVENAPHIHADGSTG
jgi:hypothetical protein